MKFYLIAYREADEIDWKWRQGDLGPIAYSKRERAETVMAEMTERNDCECFLVFSQIELTVDLEGNGIKVARYEAVG